MKNECDKMAEQLKTKDEAYAFLQRKYFHLDEKVSPALVALFCKHGQSNLKM